MLAPLVARLPLAVAGRVRMQAANAAITGEHSGFVLDPLVPLGRVAVGAKLVRLVDAKDAHASTSENTAPRAARARSSQCSRWPSTLGHCSPPSRPWMALAAASMSAAIARSSRSPLA